MLGYFLDQYDQCLLVIIFNYYLSVGICLMADTTSFGIYIATLEKTRRYEFKKHSEKDINYFSSSR